MMPMIGTRKLLHLLNEKMEEHGIKMGRDQLFDLLRFHGLLIRRRRRSVKTTDSHHWLKKYPDLIKGLEIRMPEQLWVADITYIKTLEGYSYLSLITDAFSRKIVGYCLYPSLSSEGSVEALSMAVQGRIYPENILIHHSDRGVQYCSGVYVDMLFLRAISISMTQSGNPYDNALAERMNGIIKNEFYPRRVYQNHKEARKAIDKIVSIYNDKRPHGSLDNKTPNEAHFLQGIIPPKWKSYKKTIRPICVTS
jgi:putative transposase